MPLITDECSGSKVAAVRKAGSVISVAWPARAAAQATQNAAALEVWEDEGGASACRAAVPRLPTVNYARPMAVEDVARA